MFKLVYFMFGLLKNYVVDLAFCYFYFVIYLVKQNQFITLQQNYNIITNYKTLQQIKLTKNL